VNSALASRRQANHAGNKEDIDALLPASTYHLGEGRYFEVPLVLKKQKRAQRKSQKFILFMIFGASLSFVPSFEKSIKMIASDNTVHVSVLQRKNNTFLTGDGKRFIQRREMVTIASRGEKPMIFTPSPVQETALSIENQALLTASFAHLPIKNLNNLSKKSVIAHITANDRTRLDIARLAAPRRSLAKKYNIPSLTAHLAKIRPTKHITVPPSTQSVVETTMVWADMQRALVRVGQQLQVVAQQMTETASVQINTHEMAQEQVEMAQEQVEMAQEQVVAFDLPTIGPLPQQKQRRSLAIPDALKHLVSNNQPDILALGYAPLDKAYRIDDSPFDGILTEEEKRSNGRFIPPIGAKDHAWAANPLPPHAFEAKEQKCLAEAIYFEARGESVKGQAAVAQVVLNRVRNPAYPAKICGVVYQNVTWRGRCQFSFACDGKKRSINQPVHWQLAQDIARAVTAGQIWLPEVGSSTHYHATYVKPRWARSMIRLEKIGLHIFYRTRYGGWS